MALRAQTHKKKKKREEDNKSRREVAEGEVSRRRQSHDTITGAGKTTTKGADETKKNKHRAHADRAQKPRARGSDVDKRTERERETHAPGDKRRVRVEKRGRGGAVGRGVANVSGITRHK